MLGNVKTSRLSHAYIPHVYSPYFIFILRVMVVLSSNDWCY